MLGLVERIQVSGILGSVWIRAKIDTGSERSTLDSRLAGRLGLGPVIGYVSTKSSSSNGPVRRPVVRAKLEVAGEKFTLNVGVTDRSRLRYRAIIGKDILASGKFLINPTKPPPPRIHQPQA